MGSLHSWLHASTWTPELMSTPRPPPPQSYEADTTSCPAGWEGPSCALCTSNAACAAAASDSNATCSRVLAVGATSRLKSWWCSLPDDSEVLAVVDPSSILVQCNTTGSAVGIRTTAGVQRRRLAQQAAGSFAAPPANSCTVSLRVITVGPGVVPPEVHCVVEECEPFTPGMIGMACAKTSCSCADGTCSNDSEWEPWVWDREYASLASGLLQVLLAPGVACCCWHGLVASCTAPLFVLDESYVFFGMAA